MKYWHKIGLGLSSMGLLLLAYGALRQPQWMLHWVSQLRPGALFFVDTERRMIALTIDDGPHGETTEAILNTLERHGVTATFFMLSDELPGHETTLQRLISQGHELGNHMTEDEASIGLSPEQFQAKLITADRSLSAYGDVSWFRPGMGWYNNRMLNQIEAKGYQLVLGSLFPYDTHIPSLWFTQWFVLNNLNPGDILVLHDGPKQRGEKTAQLLDQLLPKIQERGYRIVTLSELVTYER